MTAPMAEWAARNGMRRVVTIVFSDLEGSTALAERIDPESLREIMSRYFAEVFAAEDGTPVPDPSAPLAVRA